MNPSDLQGLPIPLRMACLAAASAATCLLVGGLALVWDGQAAPAWLAATPEVLAEVATCDQARDRSARIHCKRAIVLARTHQPAPVVLAAR